MVFLVISSDPLEPILVSLVLRSRPKLSLSSAVLYSHAVSSGMKYVQELLSLLGVQTITTNQPSFATDLSQLNEVGIYSLNLFLSTVQASS